MSDEKKSKTQLAENLSVLATPDGFQKYLLGSKKNGQPRAIYDVFKDYFEPKKKKKKKKKNKKKVKLSTYDVYLQTKGKKKKKKKNKYWHI